MLDHLRYPDPEDKAGDYADEAAAIVDQLPSVTCWASLPEYDHEVTVDYVLNVRHVLVHGNTRETLEALRDRLDEIIDALAPSQTDLQCRPTSTPFGSPAPAEPSPGSASVSVFARLSGWLTSASKQST